LADQKLIISPSVFSNPCMNIVECWYISRCYQRLEKNRVSQFLKEHNMYLFTWDISTLNRMFSITCISLLPPSQVEFIYLETLK